MQAIVTKYIGPTNTKGSRIKATASAGSVAVPFNYEDDAHETAARALCEKLGWPFSYVPGTLPDGSMAWVFVQPRATLGQRVQAIALGETWSSSDLGLARSYCNNEAEVKTIDAFLRGSQTSDDRFRLQTIALRIDN